MKNHRYQLTPDKMKRIFTILACLLCVLVLNAQGIIVRKPSKKQPTTQTSTAAKKQTTTTKPAKKTSAPTSSTNSNRQRILQELADNMAYVQGSTFTMGATSEQGSDAEDDEKPAHSVTLSSYYIGKTEVTQELWQAVMGNNPSRFKGNRKPVECVSWDDCQTFISKLNSLTGKKFRLPTEAEWEFAARGGIKSQGYKYSGSNTLGDVAWYEENSGDTTHDVGTKSPNELGLYDMNGNVWEWCSDWYGDKYYSSSPSNHPTGPSSGAYRVLRGGSWYSIANLCRSSDRGGSTPVDRGDNMGLRLCLSE